MKDTRYYGLGHIPRFNEALPLWATSDSASPGGPRSRDSRIRPAEQASEPSPVTHLPLSTSISGGRPSVRSCSSRLQNSFGRWTPSAFGTTSCHARGVLHHLVRRGQVLCGSHNER
jgi:hypothetical protein